MRTHRKGEPVTKDKPLLLLLAISKVMQGRRNFFVFEEIETECTDLLLRFGDLEGRSLSPHASFVDLAGQVLLWDCSLHRTSLEDPDDLTRSKVLCVFRRNWPLIPGNWPPIVWGCRLLTRRLKLFIFSHGFTFEFDSVGWACNPVQDGVGEGWFSDNFMPSWYW